METDYNCVLEKFRINSNSRTTLATLRPEGFTTFPSGSQSALEDLIRNAPGAMALLNYSGCHLEVSDAYCFQFGMSRLTILGKAFEQLYSVQPEGLEAAIARTLAGDSITLETLCIPGVDREYHGMSWTFRPWRRTRKRIGGVVIFLQDIEKHKAEDDLQSDLIGTLEHAPGFMAVTDADGRIAFMNANGRQLLGLASLEDARNSTMAQFCWPDISSSQPASTLSSRPWSGVIPLRNAKSGNSIQMLLTVFATSSSAGCRNGFIYIGSNLQDHGLGEEALRACDEEPQPSERIETLCRAMGGIGHDFNNLLLVINGYSSLLMEDLKEPRLAVKAESIFRAGERAAKLTDRLLHLSHSCV